MIGIGEWAALGTALAWTLSSLAWTSAGRQIGALATSFIRLIMAGVYLAIYGRLVRGLWFPSDAESHTWLYLGLSGFFGFFLADLLFFRALVLIGPRLVLLIQSLVPPLTALLSWVYLGDRIDGLNWIGMGITLAGICWVILGRRAPGATPFGRTELRQGVLLSLTACRTASPIIWQSSWTGTGVGPGREVCRAWQAIARVLKICGAFCALPASLGSKS